jgi:hypothetical protein
MERHLHFICPTDYLEPTIESSFFEDENYFMTSLGNSLVFDDDNFEEIRAFIKAKNITKITFVLSNTNSVILDALHHTNALHIHGLDIFYSEIEYQKYRTHLLLGNADIEIPVISYHLFHKMNELITRLRLAHIHHLNINAQIYDRESHCFNEVFSDVFYQKHFSLN